MRVLLVALVALLLAGDAIAADGAYPNATCSTADTVQTVPTVKSGDVVSYCPVSTTTQMIRVRGIADCNWTDSGGATLGIDQCSGSTSGTCTTPMWDNDTSAAWVITSGSKTGRFSLASGVYEITASGTAANGLLLCTGR